MNKTTDYTPSDLKDIAETIHNVQAVKVEELRW